MIFRVLFVFVAKYNLNIDEVDVKTVFLYSFIDQLVYILLSNYSETQATKKIICKLLKALNDVK